MSDCRCGHPAAYHYNSTGPCSEFTRFIGWCQCMGYRAKPTRSAVLILLALAFSSCATMPYRALVRETEAQKLKSCMGTSLTARAPCLAESKQRCVQQGLEPACAVDGMW